MIQSFSIALDLLFQVEGGYVNRPRKDDPGGPTNMGITLATAQRFKLDKDGDGDVDADDMKLLTRDDAHVVYAEFWKAVRGDDLPFPFALLAFDACVHSGPMRAAQWLQAALGVPADGAIGPKTIAVANAAAEDRNRRVGVIIDALARRTVFCSGLGNWEANKLGWSRRFFLLMHHCLSE